jgi:hypothetical protein
MAASFIELQKHFVYWLKFRLQNLRLSAFGSHILTALLMLIPKASRKRAPTPTRSPQLCPPARTTTLTACDYLIALAARLGNF